MNFFKNIQARYVLLIIIASGLILRIINLTIGFPMLYLSNDEAVFHLSALNMLANKTVFSLGNYGPLGAYIQIPLILLASLVLFVSGKIASISDLEFLLVTQDGYFMFIPRVLSAMFGVLTILVIYKLSLKLFRIKSVALWSAFFAAVSFNLVHISHFARSLSPALFFTTLCVLYAIESINNRKREFKNRLLSFIFAGVAFSFHQVFGIIAIFPIIVAIKTYSFKNLRYFAVSLLTWVLLIFVMNYLSLGNKIFEVFRANNTLDLKLIRTPNFWIDKDIKTVFLTLFENIKMFWYLVLADGFLLALAIYGFLIGKVEKSIRAGFVVFFLISTIFSIFVFPPVLRYFLPTIVFLPIFAGMGAYRLLNKKNIIIAAIVILLASFNSLYWNWLITHEPTFEQMRKWLDKNIPPDTPIAATFYRTVGYVPSRAASEPIREFRAGYYLRAANLLEDNYYPYNVRNILYLEAFGKDSKLGNLEAGLSVFTANYIIDAYYKDFERLLYMTNNLKLIAHFSPTDGKVHQDRIPEMFADVPNSLPLFKLVRPGPYFDILKVE